jgi:Neurotransmitter-gated ion-channel ligand binding domain/Neurotransmitter-gated ion-channel transmembrane region
MQRFLPATGLGGKRIIEILSAINRRFSGPILVRCLGSERKGRKARKYNTSGLESVMILSASAHRPPCHCPTKIFALLDTMSCKSHVAVCVTLFLRAFILNVNAAGSAESQSPVLSDRQIAIEVLEGAHAVRLSKPPLKCEVGIDPISLVRIDEARETYTMDFYTWIRWEDERLKFQPRHFGIDRDRVNIPPSTAWDDDRLWNPDIEFMNLLETKETKKNVRLEASGFCEYTVRQTGTFKLQEQASAFRGFPFDRHDLAIEIESFLWDRDQVRFHFYSNEKTDLKSAEWKILALRTQVLEVAHVDEPAPFSHAAFVLTIKREPGFYLWRICLPLVILVAIAMSVVWIPHRQLESRMILSVTTLVAITTFSIFVNTDLPKLPYLTMIDVWMLFSFILSACSAIGNVVVASSAHGRGAMISQKIDYHSRWILPCLYLIGTVLCVTLYR